LATDAAAIAGLLAEPDRLRVVAALALGAATVAEVRAATGLSARAAGTALARLIDGELVIRGQDGRHYIVEEVFRAAARAATPDEGGADEHPGASDDASKVLRAFVRDGKLVSIPAHHGKRLVILDRLAQEFEPGRRYTERQVNAILRRWHDDTAALRRYLVDDEFLERDRGEYWRAGGTYHP
jgi:hypothetical protein